MSGVKMRKNTSLKSICKKQRRALRRWLATHDGSKTESIVACVFVWLNVSFVHLSHARTKVKGYNLIACKVLFWLLYWYKSYCINYLHVLLKYASSNFSHFWRYQNIKADVYRSPFFLFQVAIKIIDTRKITEDYVRNNLYREAKILSQLKHPNIMKFYESLKVSDFRSYFKCHPYL